MSAANVGGSGGIAARYAAQLKQMIQLHTLQSEAKRLDEARRTAVDQTEADPSGATEKVEEPKRVEKISSSDPIERDKHSRPSEVSSDQASKPTKIVDTRA